MPHIRRPAEKPLIGDRRQPQHDRVGTDLGRPFAVGVGGVERGNSTFRVEFHNREGFLDDSLGAIRISLGKAIHKYNAFRRTTP